MIQHWKDIFKGYKKNEVICPFFIVFIEIYKFMAIWNFKSVTKLKMCVVTNPKIIIKMLPPWLMYIIKRKVNSAFSKARLWLVQWEFMTIQCFNFAFNYINRLFVWFMWVMWLWGKKWKFSTHFSPQYSYKSYFLNSFIEQPFFQI